MLTENKFSKYLIYAIGEIILVVIGILIALQINNWNERQKNLNRSRSYMEQILLDLRYNEQIINIWHGKFEEFLAIEDWVLNKTLYIKEDVDSVWKALHVFPLNSYLNDKAFQALQNSGDSRLYGYDSLSIKIRDYYYFYKEYWENLSRSDEEQLKEVTSFIKPKLMQIEITSTDDLYNTNEISALPQFPNKQDTDEQIRRILELTNSIEARNFFKKNYLRHRRYLRIMKKAEEDTKQLILEVEEKL